MEQSLSHLAGCGGGGGGGGSGGGGADMCEAELELGLGLSLSSSGSGVEKGKSCVFGRRILTAKDLASGFSGGRVGTKRSAADSVGPAEGGSTSTAVSNQVVGWPPIKAYRINALVNQTKAPNPEREKGVGGNEKKESSKKKLNHGNDKDDNASVKERGHIGFVKVNMDGLPIGRKVDLNAHSSYEALAQTIEEMFFKPNLPNRNGVEQSLPQLKLLDGSSEFVLTHEDKEGDWMLVGDVPWGMFLSTVKRLRIMRTSEANGLAPKFQERTERQNGRPI